MVECLLLAQVVILGYWDQVPHQASHREPASPSACVSAFLSMSLTNKKKKKKIFFLKGKVTLGFVENDLNSVPSEPRRCEPKTQRKEGDSFNKTKNK